MDVDSARRRDGCWGAMISPARVLLLLLLLLLRLLLPKLLPGWLLLPVDTGALSRVVL